MTTYLERQIRSQPDELSRLLNAHETQAQVREAAEGLHRAHRIWIVGTGSSLHAAEIGAALFAEAGRAATVVSAMRFVTTAPVMGAQDSVVVISHTGETAYALAARAVAFEHRLDTVTIARRGGGAAHTIETVEKESSETYTVSYTASLLVLTMLAKELGADSIEDEHLASVPAAVSAAIEDPGIEGISAPERLLVFTASGITATTASESALKSREAARVAAEGFDVEYLLHGQAVPLDARDRLVVLDPPEEPLLDAVAAAASSAGVAVSRLHEPSGLPPLLAQIPLSVRGQMLALRNALAAKTDPDVVMVGPWADPAIWGVGAP